MYRVVLILCLLVQFNAKAGGGNHVGNGTDYISDFDAVAWFVDPSRNIRYCVEVANEFSIPSSEIDAEISGTFNTWNNYLQLRLPQLPIFSRQLQKLDTCNGQEDLKFLFGKTNDLVRFLRKAHPNSFALTYLESYDEKQNWGKGIVWVPLDEEAPQLNDRFSWARGRNLRGILLHEWGHIFGCPHVEGTIMSSFVFKQFEFAGWSSPDHKQQMTSVDSQRFLVTPRYRAENFVGATHFQKVNEIIFSQLVGRAQKYQDLELTLQTPGENSKFYLLTVRDGPDFFRFPIKILQSLNYSVTAYVFQRIFAGVWTASHQTVETHLATLEGALGTMSVAINLNGFNPIEVILIDPKNELNGQTSLFVASKLESK